MLKSLRKIRFVMLGVVIIYLIALTCSSILADKEIDVDQSDEMSARLVVLDAAWPSGAINNLVRINFDAIEPVKTLVLSFPDYDDSEARRIDRFTEAPLQVNSPIETPD